MRLFRQTQETPIAAKPVSALAEYLALATSANAPLPAIERATSQTLAQRINNGDAAFALNISTNWSN